MWAVIERCVIDSSLQSSRTAIKTEAYPVYILAQEGRPIAGLVFRTHAAFFLFIFFAFLPSDRGRGVTT